MSRTSAFTLAAVAVVSMAAPRCARAPRPRPNVVLIVVDTLRADALGCYNAAYPDLSPEIDALARDGVQFLDVTAQSSWTRPSAASLLTAMFPRVLGVHRERYDVLPDEFVTLAEALREGGYETVGVTANPNLNHVFNFGQGFDRYVESDVVWDWMKPRSGQKQVGRRQTLPDSRGVLRLMLDHARARQPDRPVYMQIVLMEVHEGWKLVRPEFQTNYRGLVGAPRGYWDAVRQVSYDVGRFVADVSALPGWEDALFVITSDHGQGLDDHPAVHRSWGHGLLLYDSQVKVPLIFHRKAAWPARRIAERVRLVDVMPTLLDELGLPAPRGLHGVSLRPLLRGGSTPAALPRYFVTETYYDGADKVAAHTGQWTYIENRAHHEGVSPRELQPAGTRANGRLTDQFAAQPAAAREMAAYVEEWERRYPKRAARQPAQEPPKDVLDQLRALGYLN